MVYGQPSHRYLATLGMVMGQSLPQTLTSRPVTGFETEVLERLSARIDRMPPGTALLKVGRHPLDVNSPFPYFEVTPRNPNSAPLRGSVSNSEGINITIGRAASRELWISGGDILKGTSCEQELLMICDAVFVSHFSEEDVCDADGRVLRSKLVVNVGTTPVQFGRRLLVRWPFTRTHRRVFSYEPYC